MKANRGFSLVEVMTVLVISSILTITLVQVYDSVNRLFLANKHRLGIQSKVDFIIPLFKQAIEQAGVYKQYAPQLNTSINTVSEAQFITKHPVVLTDTFELFSMVKSNEGGAQADTLVVNVMAGSSCTGSGFDFSKGEVFHVVNQYYLSGNTLRCKSYDGRYLRGLKANGASNYSVALLEDVYDFQMQYAIKTTSEQDPSASVIGWFNADQLQIDDTRQLIAVSVELVIGSELPTYLQRQNKVKLFSNSTHFEVEGILLKPLSDVVLLTQSK